MKGKRRGCLQWERMGKDLREPEVVLKGERTVCLYIFSFDLFPF